MYSIAHTIQMHTYQNRLYRAEIFGVLWALRINTKSKLSRPVPKLNAKTNYTLPHTQLQSAHIVIR